MRILTAILWFAASARAESAPSQAVALERNAVVCIFADPKAGDVDKEVKRMVDFAVKCDVNLVLFPVHLAPGYPRSSPALQKAVKEKCNASQGLKKLGINRASALVLTGDKGLARRMADPSGSEEDVAAEFGFDPGDSILRRSRQRGRVLKGDFAKPGETAVAVLGPGYHSAEWMSAALGQTLMGLPPGNGVGFGVGDEGEGDAGGGGSPHTGWRRCDKLKEAAFAGLGDRFKYLKDLKKCVGFPKAGARLYDLNKDRPLFGDPRNIPPQGPGQREKPFTGSGGSEIGSATNPTAPGDAGSSTGTGVSSSPAAAAPSAVGPRASPAADYVPRSKSLSSPDEFFAPVTSGHEQAPAMLGGRAGAEGRSSRSPASSTGRSSGNARSSLSKIPGASGIETSKSATPGFAAGTSTSGGSSSGGDVDKAPPPTRDPRRPPSSPDADFFSEREEKPRTPEPEWPRRGSGRSQDIYGAPDEGGD